MRLALPQSIGRSIIRAGSSSCVAEYLLLFDTGAQAARSNFRVLYACHQEHRTSHLRDVQAPHLPSHVLVASRSIFQRC